VRLATYRDSVIAEAGFVSRYVASLTFYQRAKSLYDAGYETEAWIVTIASVSYPAS
jgi:hypothetical protein